MVTCEEKETFIISKLISWDCSWDYLCDKIDVIALDNIYKLYKNNKIVDCDDKIYLNHVGIYAENMIKDNNLSKKYYLMAFEKGHVVSIYNLALMYDKQDINDLAEKYYLIAIEKQHEDSMYNLALLYSKQQRYDLVEKYYLLAIEKEHILSMYNLALLYYRQQKYDLSEEYYLMAIDKGHIDSMYNLAGYYGARGEYELSEKYFSMAIEKGDIGSMYGLAWLYEIQQKYELSRYYYMLNAMNYYHQSIVKMNEIIECDFNLDDSIKLINILNDHNQNVFNGVLKFIINNNDE